MSAHTPGPWVVLRDPQHGGPLVCTEDIAIADVMELEGGTDEANAHLIAAAPDLLAALEDADRLLFHLMKVVPWGRTCGTDFALLNKVLCHAPVAIAKARGDK